LKENRTLCAKKRKSHGKNKKVGSLGKSRNARSKKTRKGAEVGKKRALCHEIGNGGKKSSWDKLKGGEGRKGGPEMGGTYLKKG